MAKIKQRRIAWTAPPTGDVVAHRVYWEQEGTPVGYDSQFVEVPMPKVELFIPSEAPALDGVDGTYNIGVTAVDNVGNESDFLEGVIFFDFVAPDAPTNLVVE